MQILQPLYIAEAALRVSRWMIFRLSNSWIWEGKIPASYGVLPSYYGIVLTHVLQILHKFPHTWIFDLYFISVNCEHCETSSPEEIRYIPSVWGESGYVYKASERGPVIGDTRGEIPPSRSSSASCSDALREGTLEFRMPKDKKAKLMNLSSNKVSPPNIAPRKSPSGRKASLICTRAPSGNSDYSILVVTLWWTYQVGHWPSEGSNTILRLPMSPRQHFPRDFLHHRVFSQFQLGE